MHEKEEVSQISALFYAQIKETCTVYNDIYFHQHLEFALLFLSSVIYHHESTLEST